MSLPRWTPAEPLSAKETKLLARHKRSRKLFVFLRLYRHELFDDAFQTELESMYRSTGAGKPPCPPAFLAMAMLLQGYERLSDSDAVEHTASDARWQMVLDRTGDDEPAFAQSTLVEFRARLISCDMDRRLLERTVELAKKTGQFDYKKLPQTLRVAVDSAPLLQARRIKKCPVSLCAFLPWCLPPTPGRNRRAWRCRLRPARYSAASHRGGSCRRGASRTARRRPAAQRIAPPGARRDCG
jgi:hypothetical protein